MLAAPEQDEPSNGLRGLRWGRLGGAAQAEAGCVEEEEGQQLLHLIHADVATICL